MSKSQTKDLKKFLRPFPDEIQERALWLREFSSAVTVSAYNHCTVTAPLVEGTFISDFVVTAQSSGMFAVTTEPVVVMRNVT